MVNSMLAEDALLEQPAVDPEAALTQTWKKNDDPVSHLILTEPLISTFRNILR